MEPFDIIAALFGGAWDFFTELHVPGFSDMTFAALLLAVSLAGLGIRLVFFILEIKSVGDSPKTSSTRNPKISKERRNDEF